MSIRISLPTTTRDPWSGYEVDTTATFDLSVGEAQSLVASISAQLPGERERQEREHQVEIERLESRLRALKGGAA
ncbi:hypothetical protein [Paraburkholderia tropica]|uniref:hypothetical protein n=1 Tax=Paraburkholderia tropica TaxID=92647 RepID=UPI003D265D83